jgi:hypothetical protein
VRVNPAPSKNRRVRHPQKVSASRRLLTHRSRGGLEAKKKSGRGEGVFFLTPFIKLIRHYRSALLATRVKFQKESTRS